MRGVEIWGGSDLASGETSILLDQIQLEGLIPGINQIYLRYEIILPGPPFIPHDAKLYDAASESVGFSGRYGGVYAGYWSYGTGRPTLVLGKMYIPSDPLSLTVLPEPVTLFFVVMGGLALLRRNSSLRQAFTGTIHRRQVSGKRTVADKT